MNKRDARRAMRAIPLAPGSLPYLGHALQMRNDPYGAVVRWYRECGPVFRVRLLGSEAVSLAGHEANLFIKEHDGDLMVLSPITKQFSDAIRTKKFLFTMDGKAHRELRRALGPSMVGRQLDEYVPGFSALAAESYESWARDDSIDAPDRFRRMNYSQLTSTLSPRRADEYYDDVGRVFSTAVAVGLTRMLPRFTLSLPNIRRSFDRLEALTTSLYEDAKKLGDGNGYLQRVWAAVKQGILDEDDLLAILLTPQFAGLDTTASTLASASFEVCRNSEWVGRMRDEIRSAAKPIEKMTSKELRGLRATRAFVMETLRRYPIAFFGPRAAARDFEFAGHTIPAGATLWITPPLPHLLDEHWPDALRFDPNRFMTDEGPQRTPGLYAPFSIGRRVCLGAGLAEVQMIVSIGILVRDYDVSLARPTRALRMKSDPLPVGKGLRIGLHRRRISEAPKIDLDGRDAALAV